MLQRTIIANSCTLVSSRHESEHFVLHSTKLVEQLAQDYLFIVSKVHVANKGLWTCPMRSFYILCHNQPISNKDKHPLITLLQQFKTTE